MDESPSLSFTLLFSGGALACVASAVVRLLLHNPITGLSIGRALAAGMLSVGVINLIVYIGTQYGDETVKPLSPYQVTFLGLVIGALAGLVP